MGNPSGNVKLADSMFPKLSKLWDVKYIQILGPGSLPALSLGDEHPTVSTGSLCIM